jgi:HNH endonuclease
MGVRTCEIALCAAKHYARGWCFVHYMQWFRTGKVRAEPRPTLEQRFWAQVDKTETCWLWTGVQFSTGYGQIKVNRKTSLAHRIAWYLTTGAMPGGPLHHSCGVKHCVNPAHLHEHSRLSHAEEHKRLGNASGHGHETECPAGHSYDEENTYVDRTGSRHCKRCGREGKRRRYQGRRQESASA